MRIGARKRVRSAIKGNSEVWFQQAASRRGNTALPSLCFSVCWHSSDVGATLEGVRYRGAGSEKGVGGGGRSARVESVA